MKFTCERDALVEALTTAGRAASTRGGALPVLSGVLFELSGDQLSVTGSDLDLTITITTVVSGQSDGVAVLPAKLASDIARSFGAGAITVEVSNDEAHLSLQRSKFSLRVLPADEYPRFERPTGDAVTLDAEHTGSELTVAFNPTYLLEGVEVCQSEHVALETIDALKPALVKPVDDSQFLYLLMPVRVS